MKSKISFVCQECGYDTPQWLGKCPECGSWNSLREFQISNLKSQISNRRDSQVVSPKTLDKIISSEKERLQTGFEELNTVLGGGIVKGSVTLLAGDPGIGKSTLLLQLGLNLAKNTNKVLYISGEESEEQIKLRADRISHDKRSAQSFFLVSLTDVDVIAMIIEETKPHLVIIDSIQTVSSERAGGMSGAVSQIRYGTGIFVRLAKTLNIPFLLVGHVTKEGMVAGPMVLSHMVDTVLFLEGEKGAATRLLRSFKNRFGPVDEVGIFVMGDRGMSEAKDPQELFLGSISKPTPGSVIVSTLEGSRPFLVEIQGLVVFSKLPIPRRVASGIDSRRLELLLAVLQKQCNVPLAAMDVFVNVAGGLRISDPACDLGICLAIFSSFKNIPVGKSVAIAEVGLLGELRSVHGLEKRVKEAKKLGFKQVITAEQYKTLREAIQILK